MISIKIQHELNEGSTVEKLIAQSLSLDPSLAAKYTKATADYMQKMRKAALRVTAARERKSILQIYATNSFSWRQHREHPNWFGKMGSVPMAELIAANRPIKSLTKKGNKRKRGYSTSKVINPPRSYPLGGRLPRGTRYKVDEDSMMVGILPTAMTKVQDKMSRFQDGGALPLADPERSRRYLAAIGLYIRRSTILSAKPRPLYEPLVRVQPPQEIFVKAYSEMLADKLRVGED